MLFLRAKHSPEKEHGQSAAADEDQKRAAPLRRSQEKAGQQQTAIAPADPGQSSRKAAIPEQAGIPGVEEGRHEPLLFSTRSLRKQHYSQPEGRSHGWLLALILLIMALLILAAAIWLYPQIHSFVAAPPPGLDEIPRLRPQNVDRLRQLQGEANLAERLIQAFVQDTVHGRLACAELQMQHEDPQAMDSPLSLTVLSEDYQLEDQWALAWLYLLKRDEKAFRALLGTLNDAFPERVGENAAAESWPDQLRYLHFLLYGQKVWPDTLAEKEIQSRTDRLYTILAEGFPAEYRDAYQEQMPLEVSAPRTGPETVRKELQLIRLARVDALALQELSQRDARFSELAASWQKILQGGHLETGFESWAYNPAGRSYVPSAGETFRSDTLASLQQLGQQLWLGESVASRLQLWETIYLRDQTLYAAYHNVSQAAMSETPQPQALEWLLALEKGSGRAAPPGLIERLQARRFNGAKLREARNFYGEPEKQEGESLYRFSFRENILMLTLAVLYPDTLPTS